MHNKLSHWDPFGLQDTVGNLFTPTFSRKVSIDSMLLADPKQYRIYELPSGSFEVRVNVSDDESYYYRSTTTKTLKEAKAHICEQIDYHKKRMAGPKLVWDGSNDQL